jgi:hypothetical protein
MASTMIKSVKLRIIGDDGDTETKLDSIGRKADELAKKHPELKVKINSAAATAKLGVLRADLKHTSDQADETGTTFRSAFGKSALSLSGFGDAATAASGDATMMQKAMAGLSLATGLLEPLAAGGAVAVGAIGAAVVATGAGLGIFKTIATGVFSAVSANITKVAAAQEKIASGDTGKKLAADVTAIGVAEQGLTGSQKQLVGATANAETAWHTFIVRSTAGVTSVMVPALALLPKGLALIKPFLAPVEGALRGIVGEVGKAASSPFWTKFDHMLAGHAGGDIKSLAGILGHIATGFAGIVKAFTPVSTTVLGGLDKLTAGFSKWGQTLGSHSGFQSMMSEAKEYAPQIAVSLKNIGAAAVHLVGDMAGTKSLVPVFADLLPPVTAFLDALVKSNPALVQFGLYTLAAGDGVGKLAKTTSNAATSIGGIAGGVKAGRSALQDLKAGFSDGAAAASKATGVWGTAGGKLSGLGSMVTGLGQKMGLLRTATEAETVADGEMDAAMDANPIGLIVVAIGALVVAFVELWKHSSTFRDFWIDTWKVVKTSFLDAFNFVKDHWKLILGILTGPPGAAVIFIISHWKQIEDATSSMISSVVGFFEDLGAGVKRIVGNVVGFFTAMPGRILHAVGNLADLLLNAGKAIMEGLLHGIEAGWNDVKGFVGKIGGWISSLKGPLDYDQVLLVPHGKAIMGGLLTGLKSRMPELVSQVKLITETIGGAGTVTGTPGGVRGGTNFYQQARFLLQEKGDKHPTVTAIDKLRAEIIKDHQDQQKKHTVSGTPVILGHTAALKDHTKALQKATPALIRIGNHSSANFNDVYNIKVDNSLDGDATAKKIRQMLLQLKRHNGGAPLGLA